jgi:uncharacterized membrane protein YsdA (DUF1294 family)
MNASFQHQRQRRSNLSIVALILLVALLLLPVLASLRLARSFDPRFVFGYLCVISGVTFWLYWHDKRRAETDGWRTPESTLHLAELLGGWPAAFLAQRTFRHKISKISYQIAFWAIVAFHEAASFDFLSEWRFSQAAIRLLHQ